MILMNNKKNDDEITNKRLKHVHAVVEDSTMTFDGLSTKVSGCSAELAGLGNSESEGEKLRQG